MTQQATDLVAHRLGAVVTRPPGRAAACVRSDAPSWPHARWARYDRIQQRNGENSPGTCCSQATSLTAQRTSVLAGHGAHGLAAVDTLPITGARARVRRRTIAAVSTRPRTHRCRARAVKPTCGMTTSGGQDPGGSMEREGERGEGAPHDTGRSSERRSLSDTPALVPGLHKHWSGPLHAAPFKQGCLHMGVSHASPVYPGLHAHTLLPTQMRFLGT